MNIYIEGVENIWTCESDLKFKFKDTSGIITCSKISNILYYIIFATKLNDSLILITIILWDYLNLLLANEYVGDVTIPNQVSYQV